ncbi:MAG: hypothetical protein ACI89L_000688 [Phycisphaerales bacterium]|jgi:hypothetical protein
MAKEFDKLKKEWSKVEKDLTDCRQEVWKYEQKVGQTTGVRNEGCLQLGLEIQRCKDDGMTGKTAYDFDSDKDVKACLKEIDNYQTQIGKEIERIAAVRTKSILPAIKSFWALKQKLKDEIDKRDAKKNRKVAAIDSASLPDMKKLLTEMSKFQDNKVFMGIDGFEPEDIKQSDKELAGHLKDAVTQTKEQKLNKFQEQMMTQGLDERHIKTNLTRVAKSCKLVLGYCTAAEEAIEARQSKALMENKVLAVKEFKVLQEMVDPYREAAKDSFLKPKIKGNPTLQKQLASFDKMYNEAGTELTKVAKAKLDK